MDYIPYLKENLKVQSDNKNGLKVRFKLLISIVSGVLCFILSPYGFTTNFGDIVFNLPWSILFPMLISMAFGWRYALVAGMSGAALYPFYLWTNEGWANILTSLLYLSFFTSIGTLNTIDGARSGKKVFARILQIFISFLIIVPFSYVFLFNPLLALNTGLSQGITKIDTTILFQFAVKDYLNFVFISLLANLLLRIPYARMFLGLSVSRVMFYNFRIALITLIACFIIWVSYIGLGHSLLKHDEFEDSHYYLALWVIVLSGLISSRIIIFYSERIVYKNLKIKDSEEYLKLQMEKMPYVYIVWDLGYRIKLWNPSAEKLFEYNYLEVVGKTCFETIVPKKDSDEIQFIWNELINGKDEVKSVLKNTTKSDNSITCEWTSTALRDNNSNVTEVISVVQNITEKKIIDETLEFLALQKWERINETFFDATTKYLINSLGFDYAMISTVEEGTANSLSYCINGKIIPNVSYEIAGTPCSNVYGKKMCVYTENLQQLFPNDKSLAQMGAESYFGSPLWDSNGSPLGLIALISKKKIIKVEPIKSIINIISTRVGSEIEHDIYEKALKESEQRFRSLFENMTTGFVLQELVLDNIGNPITYKYLAVNPAFERLLGIKSTEILGKTVHEVFPNVDKSILEIFFKVATSENYNHSDNLWVRGKLFDFWAFSPKKNQVAIVFTDITKRYKAEEALKLSEERLMVITESAEEWIWEVDNDGLFTFSNPVVEKILGYKPEEIIGIKHFFDFFEDGVRQVLKEAVFEIFAKKQIFKDFVNFNTHRKGHRVILKTTGTPIINKEGKLSGYRGADIDITVKKHFEEALRESEEKYRLSFMTSPDSININQMDGVYVDINEGFTRLTGYTSDDVIGKLSSEIKIWHNPEDRVKLINGLKEKGFVDNLEAVFKLKDGSLKTGLMSARVIRINNVPHILSITRDISERKQLENAFKRSEERYRLLFEKSNDAMFLVNRKNGKYVEANKAAEKLTGYSIEKLKKMTVGDVKPVNAKKRILEVRSLNKVKNLGEVLYVRPDGSSRTAILNVIPISDEKVFGIAHDITEQKNYEDALRILSRAIDQSPISVVITNTAGVIEYVNPKFSEITGYTLEESIGKKPNILKSGHTPEEEYSRLWKSIKSGKEWSGEFCNVKKNGDTFWESALISPIKNDKGEITHFVAVKEDITEKKETERKILSSIIEAEERERSRFSRELHDGLGPLLSTIKLYFQWLSETVDQEKKQIIIEKGDKNLNDAIETIREISNNLSPRILNTFGLVAALRNFIENLNQTQKLYINFTTNSDSRFEKNLEIILYRITSELINNTLKYANASKVDIVLQFDEKNENINLTYLDNGKGFDMQRIQDSKKGLGIVNIEQRVSTLNGNFRIDSQPGTGVKVNIEIPLKTSLKTKRLTLNDK